MGAYISTVAPVVPTMAAIANAIGAAIGIRPQSLPMSPPRTPGWRRHAFRRARTWPE
jgi:hypothetical protein